MLSDDISVCLLARSSQILSQANHVPCCPLYSVLGGNGSGFDRHFNLPPSSSSRTLPSWNPRWMDCRRRNKGTPPSWCTSLCIYFSYGVWVSCCIHRLRQRQATACWTCCWAFLHVIQRNKISVNSIIYSQHTVPSIHLNSLCENNHSIQIVSRPKNDKRLPKSRHECLVLGHL